jgi:putative N-acetylmannosamine-6-phosphate epimerase
MPQLVNPDVNPSSRNPRGVILKSMAKAATSGGAIALTIGLSNDLGS